ncbi:hypothetical protein HMSSN139_25510 [Paenibacillus sp. HMSSN-139]|nr:hypothetical protein HMSSN139_25510 [Paenibacillus sp. HMSSN-139]
MIRKNNAKFEMLFLLGFLATLIIAFGTFFLGLNIGIDKTEAKYAYLNAAPPGEENEASYQQQDLVTFYYVVFQPYQQFKEDYLTLVDDMSRSNSKSVSADAMKEIREKAKASYEQIAAQSIADSSPLLKEAQTDYLKSLKLFEDSMGQVKTTAGSKKGAELAKAVNQDEFTVSAKITVCRRKRNIILRYSSGPPKRKVTFRPITLTKITLAPRNGPVIRSPSKTKPSPI